MKDVGCTLHSTELAYEYANRYSLRPTLAIVELVNFCHRIDHTFKSTRSEVVRHASNCMVTVIPRLLMIRNIKHGVM